MLSILGTAKVAVALLVLGVPIIDTFWIIVRRLSQGRSPFTPGSGAHPPSAARPGPVASADTVLVIYGICLVTGASLALLLSGIDQLYAFVGVFMAFGLVLFLPIQGAFRRPEELEAEAYGPNHVADEQQEDGPAR